MNEIELIKFSDVGDALALHCKQHDAFCDRCVFEFTGKNQDALTLNVGDEVIVPLVTGRFFMARVRLDGITDPDPFNTQYREDCALVVLCIDPDFLAPREVTVGIWNKAEGREALRRMIVDWVYSQVAHKDRDDRGSIPVVHTACPDPSHTATSEKALRENKDPGWKFHCLWSIVTEGYCLPCDNEASSTDPSNGVTGATASARLTAMANAAAAAGAAASSSIGNAIPKLSFPTQTPLRSNIVNHWSSSTSNQYARHLHIDLGSVQRKTER